MSAADPVLGVPRVAMSEVSPGKFWVLLNFPGRTSVTLATDVTAELADEMMGLALRCCQEALQYAAASAMLRKCSTPSCEQLVNDLRPVYCRECAAGLMKKMAASANADGGAR